MTKVLYVPVEITERVEVRTAHNLADYQQMVGGLVEGIYFDGCTAFGDDEAKLHDGWSINHRAMRLARALNWRGLGVDVLAGNLVFLGIPDPDGNETDVPEAVLALAEKLGVLED